MTRRWYAMSSRHSSFPSDDAAPARGAWPWLLAAGPALVVVASLTTAWIAMTKTDRVIAEDYYKIGLTINRRIAAAPAPLPLPGAVVVFEADGKVRVQLSDSTPVPSALHLAVTKPVAGGHADIVALSGVDREFVGTARPGDGRRIVSLWSDTWRLPTTVVDHLPAIVVLGKVEPSS